ncbi:MAG: hypothetical protein KDI79_17250 [Anaerolineae bacterium]|nr:hypothetical protein [Anaerolineae bacterium]
MHSYYTPDFLVKIEGLTMEADVSSAVVSLQFDSSLDTADMFTLRLNNADLRLTDSALFNVGKDVEIYMGYVGNLQPMMLGEITAVSPSFPQSGAPMLTVTGYDKSHRMRQNHRTRAFLFSNASLIAAQIAAEHLLIPVVDPTPIPFKNKMQYGSDMALLKELARRNFFETYVYWDKLYFRFPRPQTEAVVLEWGRNLSSFDPRLSTSGQVGMLQILDYDQELAQTIVGLVPVIATNFDLDTVIERLGQGFIDQLVGLGSKCLSIESANSFPDALALAKALLSEILEGLFEGSGSCIGIPELRAGKMVEIQGVGKRFSGSYRLRRVTHTIDEGGYQTSFEITQRSGSTITEIFRKAFEEESSPNRQPEMSNTVIARVINTTDLKKLGQVQIKYPWLCGDATAWAKVIQPDLGTYLMPKPGDDVYVSFEKGDFDRPLVIGTVWNAKERPPESVVPAHQRKIIQSRNGHKIVLDDTGGQGEITIDHTSGSVIKIQSDGTVSIASKANMILKASGDINIEAANVKVKVSGSMDVS